MSYQWKLLWKYNDDGIQGKSYCTQVQNDLARTESEILKISEQLSIVNSRLNECMTHNYELHIHN